MEHLPTHLRDIAAVATCVFTVFTALVGYLCSLLRKFNKTVNSLGETRFKADECHEELCDREPEFKRRHKTWQAHRSNF